MLRAIQRSFALSRPLEEKLSGTGKYFNYKKGWGIVETKIGDVLIFHVRKLTHQSGVRLSVGHFVRHSHGTA